LWPVWGPLAVSSQRRDMIEILILIPASAGPLGAAGVKIYRPSVCFLPSRRNEETTSFLF
jgi:hypothetical protein